jgi:FkbM family methyltransferase
MKASSREQIRETLDRYMHDERPAGVGARLSLTSHDGATSDTTSSPLVVSLKRIVKKIPLLSPILVFAYRGFKRQRQRIASWSRRDLRRIPFLSPVLVGAYRVLKMPGRVASIAQRIENVYELQVGLTRIHDRLDSLSWHVSALRELQQAAVGAADKATTSLQAAQRTLGAIDARIGQLEKRRYPTAVDAGRHAGAAAASDPERFRRDVAELSRMLVLLHEKSDRYAKNLHTRLEAIQPVIHAGHNLVISRVDGFIMAFPAEEWRLPAYEILVGQLEPGLAAAMKSVLREGMVVIDVGANVGTYTLLALRAVGATGTVISYEPTPRAYDILKNNVQVNGFLESGKIDLRQKAVSDAGQRRQSFHVLKNSLTHNSLYDMGALAFGDSEIIEVEVVSLDRDLGPGRRVDVIKIDAEGAEASIMDGMQQLIENNPQMTIFMEFAPSHLARAKVDVRSFLKKMRDQGFRIREVVEPTGEFRERADEELVSCFSTNLILNKAVAA